MGGQPIGVELRYENIRFVVSDDKISLVIHVDSTGETKTYHFDQTTGKPE
jgi:hypothetical protein